MPSTRTTARIPGAAGRLLCALALAVLAAGCGSAGSPAVRTDFHPYTAEQIELRQAAQGSRYRLRVGDTFTVDFKYQDELDQHNVTILPDGRFTMSGLEDVRALGMTIPALDSLITAQFARDYRNPELSVIMTELGSRKVYVLGEVRQPGLYDLPPTGEGVLQAVALANGFTPNAASAQTVLIRATDNGFLFRHCDLSHLEKRGLQDAELLDVQPYDVIYVPRSAVGDIALFSESVLGSVLKLGDLFWNVYAVSNLEKVQFMTR
jgi:protein involved in polysaccharide export with SLBB domain